MKPLKTLIVEDSENDAALLLRHLTNSGYDVQATIIQTSSAMKAALAGESDWDVVLSDYSMPNFNGLDALAILKESGLDIPFIIISGVIGEDVAVETMLVGVHDYLMKDNLRRLAPAIERELENAAIRRAKKQSEEAMRLSEASLANAQRIAHIGNWDWDIQNNKLFWSDEIYRIFGLEKGQFQGTYEAFFDNVHPEDRKLVQSSVEATLTRNALHNYEHRIIRPDGEERIVCEIGEVTFDETGKPLRFTGTVQDITERRADEAKMQLLKSAVDSIAEGILITDAQKPHNPIIYTNAAFENLTGYTFEEVKGRNCRFLQGEETNPQTVFEIRQALERKETFHNEILNYHKNGEPFWNELSISPVFDKSGRLTNFVGIQQDITTRKNSEKNLRESEERFRSIVETTAEWIWATDLQGNLTYNNPAVETILGYSPQELLGKDFRPLMHEDDRENFIQSLPKFTAEKQGWTNLVFRWYHKDGTIRYLESNAVPNLASGGEVIGYRGSNRDITERQNYELSISNLAAIVESSSDAIYSKNFDGTILSWNKAAENVFGYTAAEIIGQNISIILPPELLSVEDEISEKIKRGEATQNFETIRLKKDGSLVPISLRNSPIKNNKGEIIGISKIVQDITEHKKAESSIRFQAQLLSMVEQAIIATNLDRKVIYWNRFAEKLYGWTAEEAVGRNIREIIVPETCIEQADQIAAQLNEGKSWTSEFILRHKNGTTFPAQINNSPINDSKGNLIGIVGVSIDITERRRAEQQIIESEEKYRSIVETANEGILLNDIEGRTIFVNRQMPEMLGYGADDMLGRTIFDFIFEEDLAVTKQKIEQRKQGKTETDEFRLRRKDGSEIIILQKSSPTKNEAGEITGFLTMNTDITERKKAERELQNAEAKYRSLVESSPAIVYLNEPHPPYSTIYVSPNVKVFGYSPEEWYAEPEMWSSMLYKKDRERVLREFESAARHNLETELEYRIVARDGSIHWWQDKGRFIADEEGNKIGWQGVILDVTKTKELEEQLRQSQKLESIGRLAGGIAHDFNNMLTAINGYSELTLRKLDADSPLRRNIEEIKKAGERSAQLTHQLLAFSRQQILQPVVLDLNEVITDTVKLLERLIGEDVKLVIALNSRTGRVNVDPGQLSQIIMNLAVNARDAMPHGGKLTIETANVFFEPEDAEHTVGGLPGAYVMLAVCDTGLGMDDKIQQQIFEPFFTTKELGKGTGLGLATVYGIVKQSGGNIEVDSQIGAGTTFRIYLPRVAEQPEAEEITDTPAEFLAGTETILLVEDEEMVRKLSREMLETCGYTVIEAREGLEALKIWETGDCKPDLLITDVVMPQMGGRELAEKLKERLPDIKILFTSGYTDDAVIRYGVIEPNTNFIQKPFTFDALNRKVRELLDAHNLKINT